MTPGEVLELSQMSLTVLLKVGAPIMLIALGVGLLVSFFQAITQIQEMTLAFVPKIVVLFAVMILMFPYIGSVMNSYTEMIFDRIVSVGG